MSLLITLKGKISFLILFLQFIDQSDFCFIKEGYKGLQGRIGW